MSWGLSYDIAMAELAANSLLPAGGAGGLALGVWALRQAGMPTGHIARRTVAFFVVTSAANFFALIVVGIGVFVGIVAGRGSAVLTLVPALITALGVLLVGSAQGSCAHWESAAPARTASAGRGRARLALRTGAGTVADGVDQAIALLRTHSFGVDRRLVRLHGVRHRGARVRLRRRRARADVRRARARLPDRPARQPVPLPGGIGGTEGALIGVFALYGVNIPRATAAVLLYRLFQLVIPALLGAPAFVLLRRRLARADQPALVCAPLALDVVKLPSES